MFVLKRVIGWNQIIHQRIERVESASFQGQTS